MFKTWRIQQMLLNNEDYFDGFKWCIPLAFKETLKTYCFMPGDVIYNTHQAYEMKWGDAKQCLEYSIQIKPLKESTIQDFNTEIDEKILKGNWFSEVRLEITDYKNNSKKEIITTTQGRLFTFLHIGDKEILRDKIKHPNVPLQISELKKHIEDASLQVDEKIKGCPGKNNVFIYSFDALKEQAISKRRKILYYLNKENIPVKEYDLKLED